MNPTVIEKCYGVLVTCEDGRSALAEGVDPFPALFLGRKHAIPFRNQLREIYSQATNVKVVPIKATFEVLEKPNAE